MAIYTIDSIDTCTLEHCCGAAELHSFPVDREFQNDDDRRQVNEKIRERIKDTREDDYGLLIATTNHKQTIAAELLRKCGFRRFAYFNNPNSGNDCKAWALNLHDLAKKKA